MLPEPMTMFGQKTAAMANAQNIAIELVVPPVVSMRGPIDPESPDMLELKQSMLEHGILEPLIVRERKRDFMLIAGERRLAAAKSLAFKYVPCIIKSLSERETLEAQIIAQIQRKVIHPLDIAAALLKLSQMDPYSAMEPKQLHSVIGSKVGKSAAWVAHHFAILNLAPGPREAFRRGDIKLGHALELAKLGDHAQGRLMSTIKSLPVQVTAKQVKNAVREAQARKGERQQPKRPAIWRAEIDAPGATGPEFPLTIRLPEEFAGRRIEVTVTIAKPARVRLKAGATA